MTDPAAFTVVLGPFSIVSALCALYAAKNKRTIFHEPPYTAEEDEAFWKAMSHGVGEFSRPSPRPHRSQPRRQSHRPGLPSPAQADARRVNLASLLDSLIDRRAALRVDSHLLQDPLAHSWVLARESTAGASAWSRRRSLSPRDLRSRHRRLPPSPVQAP